MDKRAIGRGCQSGVIQSLLSTQNNSVSNLRIQYHEMGIKAFLRALTRGGLILKYKNTHHMRHGVHSYFFRITNIVISNFIYPIQEQYLNVEVLVAKNWMELSVGSTYNTHCKIRKHWARELIPKKKSQYKLRMPIGRRPKFKKFGAFAAKTFKDQIREQVIQYIPKIMES